MAGQMNWTGIENKIQEIEDFKNQWVEELESGKTNATGELEAAYEGEAAAATTASMEDIKQKGIKFFDDLSAELKKKLDEQKKLWEEQERKSKSSVEEVQ